jgi:hypothetical protein
MSERAAAAVFARTVQELAPYAEDIVFIGGWVHALYLAEANEAHRALLTDDIDVTIPTSLLADGRQTLLELAAAAGFDVDAERDDAPVRVVQYGMAGVPIDLDILAEHPEPREPVRIEGQPDLLAQGYPGQQLLLDHTRDILVGPDIHPSLDPPQRIRVPTLGAYVFQKGVASTTRAVATKAVKDLVYAYEILRHPRLGKAARAELAMLASRYPELSEIWRQRLEDVVRREPLRRDMAEQLLVAGRAFGTEAEVMAAISAQFRRSIAELESTLEP